MLSNLGPSKKLCQHLSAVDINYLMFRFVFVFLVWNVNYFLKSCENEEQELNHSGTFFLPGFFFHFEKLYISLYILEKENYHMEALEVFILFY